jgi:hypothetical protein
VIDFLVDAGVCVNAEVRCLFLFKVQAQRPSLKRTAREIPNLIIKSKADSFGKCTTVDDAIEDKHFVGEVLDLNVDALLLIYSALVLQVPDRHAKVLLDHEDASTGRQVNFLNHAVE